MKTILASLFALASMLGVPGAAAQAYPVKPIRFLVGFPPGGGTDIMARVVTAKLTESVGQQVIVDNRPGANANLAAGIASRAMPDGYTVLMISLAHAVSKPLYRNSTMTSSATSRR